MEEKELLYNALFEMLQSIRSLGRSVEAIKAYLITTAQEPEVAQLALDATEEILEQNDPDKEQLDQRAAFFELLKAGKKPTQSDS
jgi:hypothetical protein